MPPKRKPLFRATLELTAGNAAVMDLGKTLGQTGVNLVEVKKQYDADTAAQHATWYRWSSRCSRASFELRLNTRSAGPWWPSSSTWGSRGRWLIHFNYHRPHTATGDQPPATRLQASVSNVMIEHS